MKEIKTVTIIGANGTIGSEVAGIFASFGNAKVYLISRNFQKSKETIKKASLSVRAIAIEKKLIPKTYEDMENCIRESDLVFESVVENYKIKEEIHRKISIYANSETIIATGTSGLSINQLAECYSIEQQKNFLGLHFFNPPYNLTLCEIIPSKYNRENRKFIEELKEYLKTNLGRDVIETKDKPAFLANRIGFNFMNQALQYAEKYQDKGGIDYIDAILGCYTGRSMPPIYTVDFVGLDVHKAIVDNLYISNYGDTYKMPNYVEDLINNNKIGKKVGEGLYKKDENNNLLVYDIKNKNYREKNIYKFEFKTNAINFFKNGDYEKGIYSILNDESEESKICTKFLLSYITTSIESTKDAGTNVMDCDIAMVNGFNWIPPCGLVEVIGGKEKVSKLCEKYLENSLDYIDLFKEISNSQIDYRKYLKAKE